MDEYTYIRTCGEGAYGDVWLTRRADASLCAVKVFKQAHEDPEIKALAKREARVLQNLKHINIVRLLDAFKSSSGRVYLVFEFCERSVFDELDANPYGLPSRATKLLAWQLLHAAAYLHDRKIVHRDIKPANILLKGDGVLKLCDFGFARDLPHGGRSGVGPRGLAAAMSTYVVTRWYRPPEVLVSDAYGPPVDIWSIGCTIAEIATGRPLFPGKSTADQLWRIMRCLGPLTPSHTARVLADPRLRGFTVPPLHKTLRQRLPELEPRLFQLVEACLCPEPRQRPTAAELLAFPYFWDVPQLVAGTPFASLYGGGVPEAAVGGQGVAAASKAQQQAAVKPAAVATAPAAVEALEPAADTPMGVSVMQMSSRQLMRLQQELQQHHLKQQQQQQQQLEEAAQQSSQAAAAAAAPPSNIRASSSKPLPKLQVNADALEVVNLQQQLQTRHQAAAPVLASMAPQAVPAAAAPAAAAAVVAAGAHGAAAAGMASAAAAGAVVSIMETDDAGRQAAPGDAHSQQQCRKSASGAATAAAAVDLRDCVMQDAAEAEAEGTAATSSSGRAHARDSDQGAVGDDGDCGEPRHQRRRLLEPAAAGARGESAGFNPALPQQPGLQQPERQQQMEGLVPAITTAEAPAPALAMAASGVPANQATAAAEGAPTAAAAEAAAATARALGHRPQGRLIDTQSLEQHFADAADKEGVECGGAGESAPGDGASDLGRMSSPALLCSMTGSPHVACALEGSEEAEDKQEPETFAVPYEGSPVTRGDSTADGEGRGVGGGSLPGPRVLEALVEANMKPWGGEAGGGSEALADPAGSGRALPQARVISTVPGLPPVPAPPRAPATVPVDKATASVATALVVAAPASVVAAAPGVQSASDMEARGGTSHSVTAGAAAATGTTEDDCHESERYDGLAELRGSTAGRTTRVMNPMLLQYQPYLTVAAGAACEGGGAAATARGSESGRLGFLLPQGASGPLGSLLLGGDRTSATTAITLSSALPAALGQDSCIADGGVSGFASGSALSFATASRYTGAAVGEGWHNSQPAAKLPPWASPSPFSADEAPGAPEAQGKGAAPGAAADAGMGTAGYAGGGTATSLADDHAHVHGSGSNNTHSDTRLLRLAPSATMAGHLHGAAATATAATTASLRTAAERRAAAAASTTAAAAGSTGFSLGLVPGSLGGGGRGVAWPPRGRGSQLAAYRVSASGSLARLPEGMVVAVDEAASPLSPSDAAGGTSSSTALLFRSQDMAAATAGGRSLAATMAARVSVGNRIAAQAASRVAKGAIPGISAGSSGNFAGFPASAGGGTANLLLSSIGGGSLTDGNTNGVNGIMRRPGARPSLSGVPGVPVSLDMLCPGSMLGTGCGTPSHASGQLHSQSLTFDSIPLHELFTPRGAPELPACAGLLPPHRRPPPAASPWVPPSANNSDSLFLLSGLGLPRGTTATSLPRTPTAGMSDSDRPSRSDAGDPDRPSPPDGESGMALLASCGAGGGGVGGGGGGGGAGGSVKNGGRFWSSLIGRMSMRSSNSSTAGAGTGAAAASTAAGSAAGDAHAHAHARTVSGSGVGRALHSESGDGQAVAWAGQPQGPAGQTGFRRSSSKVPAATPATRSRLGSGTWGEPPYLAAGPSATVAPGSSTRGCSGSGAGSGALLTQPAQPAAASAGRATKPIITGVLSVTAAVASRGDYNGANSTGGSAMSGTNGNVSAAGRPAFMNSPGALLTGEEKQLPPAFGEGRAGSGMGSESLAMMLGAGMQLMSADGGVGDGGTGPVARPPLPVVMLPAGAASAALGGGASQGKGSPVLMASGGVAASGCVSGAADRPRNGALPLTAVPHVAADAEQHSLRASGATEAGVNGAGAAAQGRAAAAAVTAAAGAGANGQLQDGGGARSTKGSKGIKSLVKGMANVLGLRKPSSRGNA